MKKILIQVVLIIAAFALTFAVWRTIQDPIEFEAKRKIRQEAVVDRLKDIRKAELAFKEVNGLFCGDLDSLTHFVKYGSIPRIRKIGMVTDSMSEAGIDEKMALKMGLITRDTIKVNVLEEVFGKDYKIDQLKYIPYTNKDVFAIGQVILQTQSGIKVPLFEARAHNNQFLSELVDEFGQEIINLNEKSRKDNRYPGLKVGSLTEANNNSGNWE